MPEKLFSTKKRAITISRVDEKAELTFIDVMSSLFFLPIKRLFAFTQEFSNQIIVLSLNSFITLPKARTRAQLMHPKILDHI